MEGTIAGLPAIAFSLDSPDGHPGPLDYRGAAAIANRVARGVVENGLPNGVLLNVNVPYLPETEMRGILITRLGLRVYRDKLITRQDPRGRPYYWIGGEAPTGVPDEGTDIGALSQGCVSITPLQMDMTAYEAFEAVKAIQW
jgi:5'-nucleotidase